MISTQKALDLEALITLRDCAALSEERERVDRVVLANAEKARQMCSLLPANRALLASLTQMRGVA